MTREERLDLLKLIEKDIYVSSIESTFLDDAKSCAIHSAIEELEQEPKTDVLDKIKTEIEQVKVIMNEEIIEHNRKDLINFINGINQCLVIINKYRK